MTCYGQSHTWTRSSSSANLPAILDYEKCNCGLYTWGECRHYEKRIAVLEAKIEAAEEMASLLRAIHRDLDHEPGCGCLHLEYPKRFEGAGNP